MSNRCNENWKNCVHTILLGFGQWLVILKQVMMGRTIYPYFASFTFEAFLNNCVAKHVPKLVSLSAHKVSGDRALFNIH